MPSSVDGNVEVRLHLPLEELGDDLIAGAVGVGELDRWQAGSVGIPGLCQEILGLGRVELVLAAEIGIVAGHSRRDPAGGWLADASPDVVNEGNAVDAGGNCLAQQLVVKRSLADVELEGESGQIVVAYGLLGSTWHLP